MTLKLSGCGHPVDKMCPFSFLPTTAWSMDSKKLGWIAGIWSVIANLQTTGRLATHFSDTLYHILPQENVKHSGQNMSTGCHRLF